MFYKIDIYAYKYIITRSEISHYRLKMHDFPFISLKFSISFK